ncbi:BBE domain-containing protein [Sporichthya sp.]|uniref:BBE domain-containing protein n=1 Tax=Sporichthya sp. TaxID=65475 RepID=UPI00345BE964
MTRRRARPVGTECGTSPRDRLGPVVPGGPGAVRQRRGVPELCDVTATDADKVFGSSAARLAQIRGAYDPDGLFAAAAVRP